MRLLNSFNAAVSADQRAHLLREAVRVLRPGGTLSVAGLVADGVVDGDPNLPGLGSRMRRIPVETEPLAELRAAGFTDLFCDELADIHCFSIPGVELRKLRLRATRPAADDTEARYEALYRGPFRSATDDDGRVYTHGLRVPVTADVWRRLQAGPAKGQFLFFAAGPVSPG